MKLTIFKIGSVLVLAIFLFLLCKGGNYRNVSETEWKSVYDQDSEISQMDVGTEKTILKLYGLDSSAYNGAVLYYSKKTMAVEELFIAEGKTKADAEKIADAVQNRLDSQKKSFEGYGTDQTALLNKSEVVAKGNYVFFGVSENVEKWKEEFQANIEK